MIIQTNKYQTQLISTHKITTKQIDSISKLLNNHYLKYKITK